MAKCFSLFLECDFSFLISSRLFFLHESFIYDFARMQCNKIIDIVSQRYAKCVIYISHII